MTPLMIIGPRVNTLPEAYRSAKEYAADADIMCFEPGAGMDRLLHWVLMPAQESASRGRVCIIDLNDMYIYPQSTLLKTLENPGKAFFILLADNLAVVTSALASRCIINSMATVPNFAKSIINARQTGADIEEAANRLRQAMRGYQDSTAPTITSSELLARLMLALRNQDIPSILNIAHEFDEHSLSALREQLIAQNAIKDLANTYLSTDPVGAVLQYLVGVIK